MRNLILTGAAAAALAACNPEPSAEERAAAERNVTSEVVQTNDTTAIDAATGEAANMAADVPFIPGVENEVEGDEAEPATATRRSASPTRPRTPAARPSAAEPAGEDEDDSR